MSEIQEGNGNPKLNDVGEDGLKEREKPSEAERMEVDGNGNIDDVIDLDDGSVSPTPIPEKLADELLKSPTPSPARTRESSSCTGRVSVNGKAPPSPRAFPVSGATASAVARRSSAGSGHNNPKPVQILETRPSPSGQGQVHPLHPLFCCNEQAVNCGGAILTRNCKWASMDLKKIEGIRWKGAPDTPFCGESPINLMDFARRIQLCYGGLWSIEDHTDKVRSVALETWAVAAAVKTCRVNCGHIAAALSLLDVRLGGTSTDVEDAWKKEGVDWRRVAKDLQKEKLQPAVYGEDLMFVPERMEEMRTGIFYPGGPISPRGSVYSHKDLEQLRVLLEKKRIRKVFVVVNTQEDPRTCMEMLEKINRAVYTWNDANGCDVRCVILSPPVTGTTDAYNFFHKKLNQDIHKWIDWRQEKNRPIAMVNYTHEGDSAIYMEDYFIRCGILPDRRLSRPECFSYIQGIRLKLRACGLSSMLDVCQSKESSTPLKRAPDGSISTPPNKNPRRDQSEDYKDAASRGQWIPRRDQSDEYKDVASRGQWKPPTRGRGYRRL